MSDAKMVTERDAILRERSAYRAGIVADRATLHNVAPSAEEVYPLPKVTRPRVVVDPHNGLRWTIRNGELRYYESNGTPHCEPPADRIVLWADLFANPTEEVDNV